MTAGESATPDFSFESIVYGSGIVDRGMVEYLETIAAYQRALNGEGGKAAQSYDSSIRLLNESWPQSGVSAEVSGRLYLFGDIIDADSVERASREWGQPTREGGQVYWDVAGAQLVSRGIVDDGDENDARLACAYAFEDDAVPSFTARPNEYIVTYQRLTKQGGEQYLRREWPELVEAIDQGLPANSFDTEAVLRLADNITQVYQDVLIAYDDLRPILSEYITYRAEYSDRAPYALVLKGNVYAFDSEENRTTLNLAEETLEYVYRPTIVFQYADGAVSVGIVASSGEGVDDENLLIIPAETVRQFQPTYTGTNLIDRVGQVGDFETGNGIVEIIEDDLTVREVRLEHLRDIQNGILQMMEQSTTLSSNGYDTPEEALEIAQSGIYSIQSHAEAIGLSECVLVVEGESVTLPPVRYEFNSLEGGMLTVKRVGEAYFMEPGDQRTGYYADVQASYSIAEEDGEDVYYPSITLRLQVSSHTEETMHVNDVAMTENVVNTYAHAPLESATIVVEQLDAEERIDQALHELDGEGETEVYDLLEDVYAEFFDPDTHELTEVALGALYKIADLTATHASETIVKSIVSVVDSILNNQEVAINTTNDKTELVAGTIVDVKFERSPDFPPQGLVFTLAGADGSLHSVAASSVKTIVLRGNA